jgi:lipopolysaccharide export LptBFGC system permease protein LptF
MQRRRQPEDWRRYRQRLRRRWLLVGLALALMIVAAIAGLAVDRSATKAVLVTLFLVLGGLYLLAMLVGMLSGPTSRHELTGPWGRFVEWCRTIFLASP